MRRKKVVDKYLRELHLNKKVISVVLSKCMSMNYADSCGSG